MQPLLDSLEALKKEFAGEPAVLKGALGKTSNRGHYHEAYQFYSKTLWHMLSSSKEITILLLRRARG